jgi:UDP-glucuronate decarboxylase
MIEGIYRTMNNCDGFLGPVNFSKPRQLTILELPDLVIRPTGSRSKIVFNLLPEDDPAQRRSNIELAIQKLEWRPTIELEDGLGRTIGYYRKAIANFL